MTTRPESAARRALVVERRGRPARVAPVAARAALRAKVVLPGPAVRPALAARLVKAARQALAARLVRAARQALVARLVRAVWPARVVRLVRAAWPVPAVELELVARQAEPR